MKRARLAVGVLLLPACGGGESSGLISASPGLEVSARQVDFGSVPIGVSARERVVLVRNSGLATIRGLTARPGPGGDHDAFSFELRDAVVAPNASTVLRVRFDPRRPGPHHAAVSLELPNRRENRTVRVELEGEAVDRALEVSPSALLFPPTVLGSRSERRLSVTNHGAQRFDARLDAGPNLGRCRRGGTEAFCWESAAIPRDSKRFGVGPGETVEVRLVFEPRTLEAVERATLEIEGPSRAHRVRLDGTGVRTGVTCHPNPLDFGAIASGACVTRAVRCENEGNLTATLMGRSIDAPESSAWRVPERGFPALAPAGSEGRGGVHEFEVELCPSSRRLTEGTLHVDVLELDATQRVSVALSGSGGGPDLDLSARTVEFSEASMGVPVRRPIAVTNRGDVSLEIFEVGIEGRDADAFEVVGLAGETVPAGATRRFEVEFLPGRESRHSAALVLRSDDAGEPEARVKLSGSGRSLPPCRVSFDAGPLDFGAVPLFYRASLPLAIVNESRSAPCLVNGLELDLGTSDVFALHPPVPSSFVLDAGERWAPEIQVLSPAEGRFEGRVRLNVSDPARPRGEIALEVDVVRDLPLAVPRQVDFGAAIPGCTGSRSLRLLSVDDRRWEVREVSFDRGGAFELGVRPHRVDEEEPATLEIRLGSRDPGFYFDVLGIELTQGDVQARLRVPVSARVAKEPIQRDDFDHRPPEKLDVLFTVDDSSCNLPEQLALAAAIDPFFEALAEERVDFRVGVTTSDMYTRRGALAGGVVSAEDPDPAATFRDYVRGIGQQGSGFERHLDGALRALSPDRLTGSNRGLRRVDARLALWLMGDERDQSSYSASDYEGLLEGLVRSPRELSVTAVDGGETGCTSESGSAGGGGLLPDVAGRTGGLHLSYCDPMADNVRAFTQHVLGRREAYPLSRTPLPGTLRVMVDDEPLPARDPETGALTWWFDGPTRRVAFHPFRAPPAGSTVSIEYEIACSGR